MFDFTCSGIPQLNLSSGQMHGVHQGKEGHVHTAVGRQETFQGMHILCLQEAELRSLGCSDGDDEEVEARVVHSRWYVYIPSLQLDVFLSGLTSPKLLYSLIQPLQRPLHQRHTLRVWPPLQAHTSSAHPPHQLHKPRAHRLWQLHTPFPSDGRPLPPLGPVLTANKIAEPPTLLLLLRIHPSVP